MSDWMLATVIAEKYEAELQQERAIADALYAACRVSAVCGPRPNIGWLTDAKRAAEAAYEAARS